MRKYETLMIMKPDLDEEQVKAVLDEFSNLVKREGGSVMGIDVWGLRRLEFPIEHSESGHYAVINFEAGSKMVKELQRVMGIRDDVLRTKTVLLERG